MLGHALMRVFSDFELVGLDLPELDITQRSDVFSALEKIGPDVIVNAAAFTAVDEAEKVPEIAMNVNGYAVGFLTDFCALHPTVLIHYSTDYVFNGMNAAGYQENSVPHPLNTYGASKLLGEQFVQKKAPQFYLIRSSWLFGPDGKNFVRTMLELAQKKTELRVVNDQIGKPTFTVDLAEVTLALLQEKRPYGIYHLVNEDPVSWYDFARAIFEEKGLKVSLTAVSSEEFARPAKRPAISTLVNTKFPLLRSHREALREYLKTHIITL